MDSESRTRASLASVALNMPPNTVSKQKRVTRLESNRSLKFFCLRSPETPRHSCLLNPRYEQRPKNDVRFWVSKFLNTLNCCTKAGSISRTKTKQVKSQSRLALRSHLLRLCERRLAAAVIYACVEASALFRLGGRVESIALQLGDVSNAGCNGDAQDEEEDDYEPDSDH